MTTQKPNKLNWLEQHLPEGLVVDSAWLTKHGYSTSLRSQYVKSGRLEQPTRQLYWRNPRGPLTWQQVVISLQTILRCPPVVVGGRTALELQGYAHYLPQKTKEVHLYGSEKLPAWLQRLSLGVAFVVHNDQRLFANEPITRALTSLSWNVEKNSGRDVTSFRGGVVEQPYGQWDWPLTLATPERAVLQLLDELPHRESFHQVDMLFSGLTSLSPERLKNLLQDCRSVKVKRLFFFFAERHHHAWYKRLNRNQVNFGTGKRMLVKGGRLDPATQITVPEDLDGVQ